MLLGMGVLTAACVFLGLFPTAFVRLLDPLTQQLTGQQISGQLSVANGLVLASLTEKAGTVSTLGIALMGLCLLPIPLGAVAGLRAQDEDAPRPDLGLRPARFDAADGIHRHGFLEADPDDLQGAVPPAARGAARIRLFALLCHQRPV